VLFGRSHSGICPGQVAGIVEAFDRKALVVGNVVDNQGEEVVGRPVGKPVGWQREVVVVGWQHEEVVVVGWQHEEVVGVDWQQGVEVAGGCQPGPPEEEVAVDCRPRVVGPQALLGEGDVG